MRLISAMIRFAIVALLSVSPTTVQASQVRPVNLEQMTEHAATVFSGRCLDTTTTLDSQVGREVTTATFEVQRAVKGEVGSTIAVKMLAAAEGIAGMPRFRPGDEVVLFLYRESALGLSSPVGLGQGRFSVITDKQGRKLAVNDLANKKLLQGLTPLAQARLGSALEQWKGRKSVQPNALLDMAQSLIANGSEP